ncbi:MAG: cytochrome c oxidase assembly protein [Actinomycetota bacterium]|nr:cytochrome c oxidase assembly protein [Actinomycetota bacterium]
MDMNMGLLTLHAGFFVKYIVEGWSLGFPTSFLSIFIPSLLYVRGFTRVTSENHGRPVMFAGGMAILTISLNSPMMFWSMAYLWVHALIHVLVMIVAPPLIAGSRPWKAIWAGIPSSIRSAVWFHNIAKVSKSIFTFISYPRIALLYFVATMWVWFIPSMMSFALSSQLGMQLMHFTFVTSGMSFFINMVDSDPYVSRVTSPISRLLQILGAGVASWLAAMFLTFSSPLYPEYAATSIRTLSALGDQQIAASIIWVLCMEPFFYTGYYNIKLFLARADDAADKGIAFDPFKPWVKNQSKA